MRWSLAFLATQSLLSMVPALAAEDPDEGDIAEEGSDRRGSSRAMKEGVIREIERGFYIKTNVGTTAYLMNRSKILRAGTTLDLVFGGDFYDKERASAAFDFTIGQALHNGLPFDQQGEAGYGPNALIQGDIHVVSFLAGFEGSFYPFRRFGIGGHLGGGVSWVPLLLNKTYYDEEVVGLAQGDGAWGGPQNKPPVHQGIRPTVYVGPTFEYYTKLSHFSLGLDADLIFPIGLDLGVKATIFLKYSF